LTKKSKNAQRKLNLQETGQKGKLTETNAAFKNPATSEPMVFPLMLQEQKNGRRAWRLELDLDLKTGTLPFPLKPLNGMGVTILLRATVTLPCPRSK
jgi:hypothetical protein